MKLKSLKLVEGIVCLIFPILLAVSIILEIWYLPLIFILAAMVMFGILISRAKEVLEDEGTRAIDDKAGGAATSIGSIAMILAGAILLAIGGGSSTPLGHAAITLYAAAFGLGTIQFLAKLYYKSKLSGK